MLRVSRQNFYFIIFFFSTKYKKGENWEENTPMEQYKQSAVTRN
jgi:hypothetical protein